MCDFLVFQLIERMREKMNECGIFCWQPRCLQKFAKTRWFTVVYAILGTIQAANSTYFAITLTTIEKRFRIPSQTLGIIISGNDISQILLSLILPYFSGQKNSPKWMSLGIICKAMASFIMISPHLIYGPGEEALQYTQEYFARNQTTSSIVVSEIVSKSIQLKTTKLCQSPVGVGDDCDENFSYIPLILIFVSQFIFGIGSTLYASLGTIYIDNNTKRQSNTPMILSFAFAMRCFGPAFGYAFAYFILKFYIAPSLTPIIPKDDDRWMGAWWLGCLLFGFLMLILAGIIGLFPESLRTDRNFGKFECDQEKCNQNIKLGSTTKIKENVEMKNFPKAIRRLITNKLLMLNCFSRAIHMLFISGSSIFMGRLMEVQFNKTSAGGSVFTGPLNMLGISFGILLSGWIMKRFKPAPKYLLFWNVIVGIVTVCCTFSYTQLGCDNSDSSLNNGLIVSCNSNCVCDGISYSPVCDRSTDTTYFSPCHAGCKAFDEKQNIYGNCTCTSGSINTVPVKRHVSSGACIGDCNSDYFVYSFLSMASASIFVTGTMASVLINIRSVEPRDKALGQGFALFTSSLFGSIPGPIIFGRIIDSSCILWNNKCGRQGNCLLYDSVKFRYYMHSTAAAFLTIGVFLQLMVWYYGQDLDLYCDSNDDKPNSDEDEMYTTAEIQLLNGQHAINNRSVLSNISDENKTFFLNRLHKNVIEPILTDKKKNSRL